MGEFQKRIEKLRRVNGRGVRHKLWVKDILQLGKEMTKEFPIKGWLFGIQHDLSQEESHELYQWAKKWLIDSEVKKGKKNVV